MSTPAAGPNPERRSNAALYTMLFGLGLLGLAWVLGLGAAVFGALNQAAAGAGFTAFGGVVGAMMAILFGFIFTIVGGVWILIQVIADQTQSDRYTKIER